MSKRKKRLDRTAALLAIQTMPRTVAQSKGRETLASFTREYNAAEEEKAQAPIRAALTEQARILQEMIQNDSVTLYTAPSSYLAATAQSIGTGEQFNGVSPEAIKATVRRALSEAEDQISEGTLTDSGRVKLRNLASANRDIDWTQSSSFFAAYTLLRTAGELHDQGDSDQPDLIVREELEPPEQPAGLESVEHIDLSSRDGQRKAIPILMRDMQIECQQAFQIFSSMIEREFHYSFSEDEVTALIEVMRTRNLPFTSQNAWSTAKLVCIKRGLLPRSLMSKQELFDELVETSDTQSWAGRQELRRQERILLGQQ